MDGKIRKLESLARRNGINQTQSRSKGSGPLTPLKCLPVRSDKSITTKCGSRNRITFQGTLVQKGSFSRGSIKLIKMLRAIRPHFSNYECF